MDGALGDLEAFGQGAGRQTTMALQEQQDREQAIGTHGHILQGFEHTMANMTPFGKNTPPAREKKARAIGPPNCNDRLK
ncbi:hypothetical protein D3C86_1924470 [compost metagenome]